MLSPPQDSLFGWANKWTKQWIDEKRYSIFNIADLLACFEAGSASMRKADPAMHFLVCELQLTDPRPRVRRYFNAPQRHLQITRTYCIRAYKNRSCNRGVLIKNFVFDDVTEGAEVLHWDIMEVTERTVKDWRRGFYDEKKRTWETEPPEWDAINAVV